MIQETGDEVLQLLVLLTTTTTTSSTGATTGTGGTGAPIGAPDRRTDSKAKANRPYEILILPATCHTIHEGRSRY
jgi:hypothetical protein